MIVLELVKYILHEVCGDKRRLDITYRFFVCWDDGVGRPFWGVWLSSILATRSMRWRAERVCGGRRVIRCSTVEHFRSLAGLVAGPRGRRWQRVEWVFDSRTLCLLSRNQAGPRWVLERSFSVFDCRTEIADLEHDRSFGTSAPWWAGRTALSAPGWRLTNQVNVWGVWLSNSSGRAWQAGWGVVELIRIIALMRSNIGRAIGLLLASPLPYVGSHS